MKPLFLNLRYLAWPVLVAFLSIGCGSGNPDKTQDLGQNKQMPQLTEEECSANVAPDSANEISAQNWLDGQPGDYELEAIINPSTFKIDCQFHFPRVTSASLSLKAQTPVVIHRIDGTFGDVLEISSIHSFGLGDLGDWTRAYLLTHTGATALVNALAPGSMKFYRLDDRRVQLVTTTEKTETNGDVTIVKGLATYHFVKPLPPTTLSE